MTQVLESEGALIGRVKAALLFQCWLHQLKLCWSLFCEPEVVKAWVPSVICAMTALQPRNSLTFERSVKAPSQRYRITAHICAGWGSAHVFQQQPDSIRTCKLCYNWNVEDMLNVNSSPG